MTHAAASTLERPTPGNASTAPACAAVDLAHLARYTFGNRALEIEVLQLFVEQAPTYLEALRTATTEKAWRDAAHTIKGSARAVGAMQVGAAAEAAEALKCSPDRALKAEAVAVLDDALADAKRFISELADAAR